MVSMSSLGYFIKEALTGFVRNLSTSLGSVITIFLSLVMIGVFVVGMLIVDNTITSVEDQVNITVYVDDTAKKADIDKLSSDISTIEGVASVGFTTKEQALENFTKSMEGNSEIVEQMGDENPLPASIDVELSEAQQVDSVADAIIANPMLVKVCDNPENPDDSIKYGQETVDRLFSITNYIRYIGIFLVALLIVIALIFINNTIRLAILARKKEIGIMRLVGASNGFIRGPFLMEGVINSIIGWVLAILGIHSLKVFALPKLEEAVSWLPIALPSSYYYMLYIALLVAGLFIGLVGAMMSMRKHLKV